MNSKQRYQEVLRRMREVAALRGAQAVLSWDQETHMPEKGTDVRAQRLSTLATLSHQKFTDSELGKMLADLEQQKDQLSSEEWVNVREWKRDRDRAVKLPEEHVREISETSSKAHTAWVNARKASDFAAFAPLLQKIVELNQKSAEIYGYEGERYDALLDGFEPGMTVKKLDPLLNFVRDETAKIVQKLSAAPQLDDACVHQKFPIAGQEALSQEIMQAFGMDEHASRLDKAVHPFCMGLAPTDVRITTRYNENYLTDNIYSVMHEVGHALYELGFPTEHIDTPLADAISLGIHESQSRSWENLVGRSLPFAEWVLPLLRKHFPEQFAKVSSETYYRAVNKVKSSAIRVDADEVTYNLHIVLRYEIERGLLNNTIAVNDLPQEWNERMIKYLGYTPKNDREGVLQDVHWSHGGLGYFPTYTLGNLYAAQFWACMKKTLPNVDAEMHQGNFSGILKWMRENIHQHGRRFSADEICTRICGETLNAQHFVAYIKNKYGALYGVNW